MVAIADKNSDQTVDQTVVEEVSVLVRALPREKARSVLDYATYLADCANEEEWDRICERVTKTPKFKAWIERVERDLAEGKTEPLDFNKL